MKPSRSSLNEILEAQIQRTSPGNRTRHLHLLKVSLVG
jgi:hypothetical protein